MLTGACVGQRLALLYHQTWIAGRWLLPSRADALPRRCGSARMLGTRLEGRRLKQHAHAAVAVAAVSLCQAAHLHAPAGAHIHKLRRSFMGESKYHTI